MAAPSNEYDAALKGVRSGKTVGLLGLEFSSRRRNRVNGRVISSGPNGFAIKVGQSFGNCPKYIQTREIVGVARASRASLITEGTELSPPDRQLVGGADTFFIASTSGDEGGLAAGVDVSHRGGNPGFVRLVSSTEFLVPDFTGNFLFNTLGNILLEPRVGLLFVDWSDGTLLQIAAEAEIIWDGPDVDAYAGAKRALRFRVSKAVRIRPAVRLHWSKGEQSPFAAKLGPWRPA
ncbi:MAG: pyridoxamine 5'-phosphate oxidase family protein [Altererythrobacter sp.]